MKRTKRKYARRTTPVASSRDGIEPEGSVIPQVPTNEGSATPREVECSQCKKLVNNGGECEDLNCMEYPCPSQDPIFTFGDLPLSVRMQVENTLKMRKRLKLPDDSTERTQKAIKMFRGDKAR